MHKWQYWEEIGLYIFFNVVPLFFIVFMNIHEFANYANMITCIFDHKMKGALCLSFYLEQFFCNLWLKAVEILLILYIYPHS